MTQKYLILILAGLFLGKALSVESIEREYQQLPDKWLFQFTAKPTDLLTADDWSPVHIPHTWNADDGMQIEKNVQTRRWHLSTHTAHSCRMAWKIGICHGWRCKCEGLGRGDRPRTRGQASDEGTGT